MEHCNIALVRRVAAMLDLDPDTIVEGEPLSLGWHFMLLGADTRRSALRPDGFPGLGLPMPDLGLPRLRLVGRTVEWRHTVTVGSTLERLSAIRRVAEKRPEPDPLTIVTIEHELRASDSTEPSIAETQIYALLAESKSASESLPQSNKPEPAHMRKTWVPDAMALFQYSALCFNSHRIHLDRDYARTVEGFPDLVVNGGLTTLMLTEFARLEVGLDFDRARLTFSAPLFCDRPVTMAAGRDGDIWRFTAHDDAGRLAAGMELVTR